MAQIPHEITAGVTVEFRLTLPAFMPPDWALTLYLRGPEVHDVEAAHDGDQHLFSVAASETASWEPGAYWYALRASDGAEVHEIDDGRIEVLPDLSQAASGYDGKTHVEKVLAAIEAVIEGRATIDQQMYMINNRQLMRTQISQLLQLRREYKNELVRLKRAERGQGLGRLIKVRF